MNFIDLFSIQSVVTVFKKNFLVCLELVRYSNVALHFLFTLTVSFLNVLYKVYIRGGVEDTRLEAKAKDTKKIRGKRQGQPFRGQSFSRPRTEMLEAKAKDTKKIRGQGQGQPFRGQSLSRPRTGMLEAKAKDQGHRRKCSPKKKVLKIFFQAISNSLTYPEFLIGVSPALKL